MEPVRATGCTAKQHAAAQSQLASAADRTVDALYYRLDLRLNIPTASVQGVTTVRVRVVLDSTETLTLDLSESMILDSVRTNNQRLTTLRFPQSFRILLPRPFHRDEVVTTEISYHGVPAATGFGSFYFGTLPGGPWVWSLSEPYGARDWWPCKDHPLDKADSVDILVTCPTGLRVGSNGKLIAVHDNGDGTSTHFWAERYPIATYLVSIAVSNYAAFSNWFVYSSTDSMEILNYVLPEHLALAQQQLPKTVEMLRIFSTLFGAYPFLKEKYGHSEFGRGGAMEHQTMTSTTTFDEDVISHELAHQWFGDLITCATWQDLWLNEGFATYSESLYREARYGRSEYWRLITERMSSAMNAKGSLFRTDTSSVASLFAVTGVYAKGASVLHMLRHVTGDSLFFRILATYCADTRFRYGTASTADFRSVCEAVTGKPLGWFFDEWIYGESFPHYTLRWSTVPAGDSYRVMATLSQTSQNSSPSFFQMPVDLRCSVAGRDTTVALFNSTNNETFELLIPFRPDRVNLDPDRWILREILAPDPLLPETAQLDQNYPNPFNAGTTMTMRLPGRIRAAVRIYDLLGRRLATISDGIQEPGTHPLRWEGNDDAGHQVASGVYVVRLETTETTLARRLLLLR